MKRKIEKYQKWVNDGENEVSPMINYTVTKRSDCTEIWKRVLLILAYAAVDVGYAVLFLVVTTIPALLTFVPLLTWIMIHFTWCFTKVEYEYKMISGEMTVRVVYGDRFARILCKLKLADAFEIIPIADYSREDISKEKQIWCVSAKNAKDTYAAVYQENGKDTVLFFQATEKALRTCKRYNPKTVVTKTEI